MSLVSLLIPSVGHAIVLSPIIVYSVISQLWHWIRLARYHEYGNLAEVPGPWIAAHTRLWLARAVASGRCNEHWMEANERYGPLVRIGPNHVLTDDPSTLHKIQAARSEYRRGPWFDSLRMDPHAPNIVSQRDESLHNRLKAKLYPGFNGRSLARCEEAVDALLLKWIRKVGADVHRKDSGATIVDMARPVQLLTVDTISRICFGFDLGCIAAGTDQHDLLKTVETGNKVCQFLSVFNELSGVVKFLSSIPLVGKFIVPRPSDRTGVGKIMGIVDMVFEERMKDGMKKDVVSRLIQEKVPREQIDQELVVTLVAGFDTTATAIQSALLAIITNPQVYNAVKAEIRLAVASGSVSLPVQSHELKQLAYLQACVVESLRKFPPVAQLRERVVPAQGDYISGYRLPGGTYVGLNLWGAQLNKDIFGEDAKLFRPERWLIEDEARLRQMHQTVDLVFGNGSTKCIGTSLAMMEVPKVIFELLRHYDISIANPWKPWSSTCHGIFFQKDLNVRLSLPGADTLPTYEDASRASSN